MVSEIATQIAMNVWQPIETAPNRRGSRVLLFCMTPSDSVVVIGTRIDDDEWEHEEGGLVKNITHWMPLPEPPQ